MQSHCYCFIVGVEIGPLPNLDHDVSGTLVYISTTRILIRDFHYDGGGTGKELNYRLQLKQHVSNNLLLFLCRYFSLLL